MKKILLIALVAFIAFGSAFAQGTELFTAEDLMSLKRISSPSISPDGKNIVYVVSTPNVNKNTFDKQLFLMNIESGEATQLTDEGKNYSPIWSPKGEKIAFISTREDEIPQIFVRALDAKRAEKITEVENGVGNILWSPDGKYFSFTSEVKMDKTPQELYPNQKKANVRIYNSVPARHWDHWIDESYSHLFIVPAEGGEAKDLMPNQRHDTPLSPFGGVEEISWSPDGKEIAYTCKKLTGLEFVTTTNSDVYVYNIATGTEVNISKGMPGFDKMPRFSPDNQKIAFTSQKRAGFESDKIRIMIYDRNTKKIEELTKNLDQWVSSYLWSPDNKYIYATATNVGSKDIFRFDVNSKEVEQLTKGEHVIGNISLANNTLAFTKEDFNTASEIYTMPVDGKEMTKITSVNDQALAQFKKSEVGQKWYTAKDGKKIHCWIIYPPDFDENKEYPVITYCQGGPQSMISPRFHYRWNFYMMASQGYIVLAPNRRGLPGFGQDWNDAISMDWGGMPMQDIMTATDEFKKEKYTKNDGFSAIGASAGGFTTFWLAGNHEGRYKAFLSHCGVFNFESMYGSTEELWFPNWEWGGPYWDKKNAKQYAHSPHKFAQNWDTPIMITTGEYDFRVPYTQSLEAFTVAQAKGIPSTLMVFPDETHFIAKTQEFIVWADQLFKFLDTYTK